MPEDLGACLFYAVNGLAMVVCAGVIARALRVSRDAADVLEPAQGHRVERGLTDAGARAVRPCRGLGCALVAWTALCGLLAQVAGEHVPNPAGSAFPLTNWTTMAGPRMQHTGEYAYETSSRRFPAGVSPVRVLVELAYVEAGGRPESGTATFKLRSYENAGRAMLVLDMGGRTFDRYDAAETLVETGPSEDVTEELIETWFQSGGLAAAAEQSKTDALTVVRACFDDPNLLERMGAGAWSGGVGALHLVDGGGTCDPTGIGAGLPDWLQGLAEPARLAALVLGSLYVAGVAGIWLRQRALLR